MPTDQEKARLGAETIKAFFQQFGKDKETELILEILLKEIIYAKALPLPSARRVPVRRRRAGQDGEHRDAARSDR